MPSYKELLAEKQALEAKLEEVRANEVAGVIAQIQQLMADYGLTTDDLLPRRRGRPAGSGAKTAKAEKTPYPPKYRDPKTGKTWSGRGRQPGWLGKNINRFLIPDGEA